MKKFFRFGIQYVGRQYTGSGTHTDVYGNHYNDDVPMCTTWNMMPGDQFSIHYFNFIGQYKELNNQISNPKAYVEGDYFGGCAGDTLPLGMEYYNTWQIRCEADANGNPYLIFNVGGGRQTDLVLQSIIADKPESRIGFFDACDWGLNQYPVVNYPTDIPYYTNMQDTRILRRRPLTCGTDDATYIDASPIGNPNKFYSTMYNRNNVTAPLIFKDIETEIAEPQIIQINPTSFNCKLTAYTDAPNAGAIAPGGLDNPQLLKCNNILSLVASVCKSYVPQDHTRFGEQTDGVDICGWVWPRLRSNRNTSHITTYGERFRPFGFETIDNITHLSSVLFRIQDMIITNAATNTNMNNVAGYYQQYPGYIYGKTFPTFAVATNSSTMRCLVKMMAARYGTYDYQSTGSVAFPSSTGVFGYTYIQTPQTPPYSGQGPIMDAQFYPSYIACSHKIGTSGGSWGIFCQSMTVDDNTNTATVTGSNGVVKCMIVPSLTSDWPALDIYTYDGLTDIFTSPVYNLYNVWGNGDAGSLISHLFYLFRTNNNPNYQW